jgi:hypothetical protein
MNQAEVITIMREHLEGLFPKTCGHCQRRFASLKEYLLNTEHAGSAMPYDADAGDWNPLRPMGTITFANCRCGSTLALSSEGMPLAQLWPLLNWARIETQRRGMTPQELLNYLRDEICDQVLAAPDRGSA